MGNMVKSEGMLDNSWDDCVDKTVQILPTIPRNVLMLSMAGPGTGQ